MKKSKNQHEAIESVVYKRLERGASYKEVCDWLDDLWERHKNEETRGFITLLKQSIIGEASIR